MSKDSDNQNCHICESLTDWECQTCDKPVCEDCTVDSTIHRLIEETLCSDCGTAQENGRCEEMERDHELQETKAKVRKKRNESSRIARHEKKIRGIQRKFEIYKMPFATEFVGLSEITAEQVQEFIDYFGLKRFISKVKYAQYSSIMQRRYFVDADKYSVQETAAGIAYSASDHALTFFRKAHGGEYCKAVMIAMNSDLPEFNEQHSVFLAKRGFCIIHARMAMDARMSMKFSNEYIAMTKDGPVVTKTVVT